MPSHFVQGSIPKPRQSLAHEVKKVNLSPPNPFVKAPKKKFKQTDCWLMPLSDVNPAFSFSQPNHLPMVRPRKIRSKVLKPKNDIPKKVKKVKKVPWYEIPYQPRHSHPQVSTPKSESVKESVELLDQGVLFGVQDFGLYGCSQTSHPIQEEPSFPVPEDSESKFPQEATPNHCDEGEGCNDSPKGGIQSKLKRKVAFFQHQRSGKHGSCIGCGFIQLSNVHKVAHEFRLLAFDKKIMRLKLHCSELQFDQNILQVAKCMKIQNIVEFLSFEFGHEVWLSFKNQPLFFFL